MELIFSTPFVIRVLASLFVILIIYKFWKQLAVSIFAGLLVLAFWSGHSLATAVNLAWQKLSSANLIFLLIAVSQVIWLSNQMSETGVMKDLVNAVRARVSQRMSMALLPAVIGLLPMPGGAAFSAPLVDSCDSKDAHPPLLKTKINFWFRHIWEYWWPLYPGVLLAIDITGLSIPQFVFLLMPMTFISFLSGYFFLLRKIPSTQNQNPKEIADEHHRLSSLLLPIIVVISVYAGLKLCWPQVSQVNKYLPLLIGILMAQLTLQLQRPLPLPAWKKIVISKNTLAMVLIVALILVYGSFIDAKLPDGSLLVSRMREELSSWGIPFTLVCMLIPFISGITMGLAIGYVGASFPIVISLIGPNPELRELLSITVLAYGSGFAGMLLSPVHVCLVLTNQFFKTSLIKSLVELLKPASVILFASGLMYLIIC